MRSRHLLSSTPAAFLVSRHSLSFAQAVGGDSSRLNTAANMFEVILDDIGSRLEQSLPLTSRREAQQVG